MSRESYFNGESAEFIKKEIDKQNQKELALWAADCAERALSYFEEKYPEDNRPRQAIEAARAWARDEISVGEARKAAFAAHAAAREANDDAARAVARAAGHAAGTAHMAGHAPHAAAYAVKAAESENAVGEREWQFQQLPEYLRSEAFPDRDSN